MRLSRLSCLPLRSFVSVVLISTTVMLYMSIRTEGGLEHHPRATLLQTPSADMLCSSIHISLLQPAGQLGGGEKEQNKHCLAVHFTFQQKRKKKPRGEWL